MIEEQPKDNLCDIKFNCCDGKYGNECVHRKNKKTCKYFNVNFYTCSNSIAQVQAMSKYLKHIGLELGSKGFSSDIYAKIQNEVKRAKELHENKDYTPADMLASLTSELGEVAHEIDTARELNQPISNNYVDELIQVAAVCIRMIEDFRKVKI
jgi:NTP pyrophosphatase (non-canonical NTP hydrolase)